MPSQKLIPYNADKAVRKLDALLELLTLLGSDIEAKYENLLDTDSYQSMRDKLAAEHKAFTDNYQSHVSKAKQLRVEAQIAISKTSQTARHALEDTRQAAKREIENLTNQIKKIRSERNSKLKQLRAERDSTLTKLRRERDSNTKLEKSKAAQYLDSLTQKLSVADPLLLEAFDLIEANCNEARKRERYNKLKKELFLKYGLTKVRSKS